MGGNMTQIETIKILLGESANLFSDNQIEVYIQQAECDFMNCTKRSEIPAAAVSVINEMVVVKCNRQGTEGLQSQSFSGISDSFLDGYPINIINQINGFRKVKIL